MSHDCLDGNKVDETCDLEHHNEATRPSNVIKYLSIINSLENFPCNIEDTSVDKYMDNLYM